MSRFRQIALMFLAAGLLMACDESGESADADTDVDTDVDTDTDTEPFLGQIGEVDNTFYIGPYLMHTTTTAIAIAWETEEAGSTRVEYGLDAVSENTASGEDGTMHRVYIDGLQPETLYRYRACTGDTCTAELSFATAPEPGTPFRFTVCGDSRSDPVRHAEVAASMIESEPTVVFNTGDIVHDGEHRILYKQHHFDPARRLGQYVPIYVAIGNHEFKDYDPDEDPKDPDAPPNHRTGTYFLDYMIFPGDPLLPDPLPPAPDFSSGIGTGNPEFSYAVRYGDAFFLVLDDTTDTYELFSPYGGGLPDPPLLQWLQAQVASEAAQTARWRFAFMHYPPNSTCIEAAEAAGSPYGSVQEVLVPLFKEHDFHALFTGHVHIYERQNYDGFLSIVTGGGGAGLDTMEQCTRVTPQNELTLSVHHHVEVDLDSERAEFKVIDYTGNLIDRMVMQPDGSYEIP